MRLPLLTLTLAALCSGCIKGVPVAERGSEPGPLPYAAVRAAPANGAEPIMLTAGINGMFVISDDCVLIHERGKLVMPHFFDGTTVGRDAGGPYIRDGETRQKFYDGDAFRGGGGTYPWDALTLRGNTRSALPDICAVQAGYDRVTSINPGFTLAN